MTTMRIEDTVERLGEVQQRIKELQEVEEALKDELREALDYDEYEFQHYELKVQHNRRIDENRAIEKYGDKVCSLKWDSSKAKKVLTGDEYDALYNEGKKKIVLSYIG